ncbi:MAG: PAS domain S-box protein [Thermodesulfovibrionales bacterium]|nr:PAS domain S-box protein [Thermodesulfovibrionales bacterium]
MSAETEYLLLFIFLIVIFIFFYLLKAFLKFGSQKKKMEQKDTSHVGFVVDTFHDLVSKLKEKEKELEVLKKLAEQRAGDVESYNRNILQSVPSGVISFDRDLRIKTMNSSAEKILGIEAEDAIERNCEELFKNPAAKLLRERFLCRSIQ